MQVVSINSTYLAPPPDHTHIILLAPPISLIPPQPANKCILIITCRSLRIAAAFMRNMSHVTLGYRLVCRN